MRRKGTVRLSRKQSLELADEAIDEISHMLERFKNRRRTGNLRFVEGYINGELETIVVFSLICGCGQANDLVAAFQWEGNMFPTKPIRVASNCANSNVPKSNYGGDHQFVFVFNIQLVDEP